MKDNLETVDFNFYKLKNQNGLKKLIKRRGDWYLTNYKEAVRLGLTGYPTRYPCLVRLSVSYHGFHYPDVIVLDKERLIKLLNNLEGEQQ